MKVSRNFLFLAASLGLITVSCSKTQVKPQSSTPIYKGLEYEVGDRPQSVKNCFTQESCWVYQVGETQYSLFDLKKKDKELQVIAKDIQSFQSEEGSSHSKMQEFRLHKRAFDKIMEGSTQTYRNLMTLQLAKQKGLSLSGYIESVVPLSQFDLPADQWPQELARRSINIEGLSPQQIKNAKTLVRMEKQERALHRLLSQEKEISPLVIFLEEPKLKFAETAEHPLRLGAAEKQIQLDFFDSFRCPECTSLFLKLYERYQNKAQFRLHFTSTSMNPIQRMVANAYFCARDQGEEVFIKFYQNYAGQVRPFVEDEMVQAVQAAGIELPSWNQCRFQRKYDEIIDYQQKYSQYMGLQTLPALLVNGKTYFGIMDSDQLFSELDRIQPLTKPSFWQKIKNWIGLKD